MKYMMTAGAFVCALSFAAAQAAPPAAPAGLDTMRQAFSAALAAKHIDVAMKMTSFPLIQNMYQAPPKVTAAQFAKDLTDLGLDDAGVQHCIAHDPLTLVDAKSASDKHFANTWNIDCNGNEYHFAQVNGAWMFIGYENINE